MTLDQARKAVVQETFNKNLDKQSEAGKVGEALMYWMLQSYDLLRPIEMFHQAKKLDPIAG